MASLKVTYSVPRLTSRWIYIIMCCTCNTLLCEFNQGMPWWSIWILRNKLVPAHSPHKDRGDQFFLSNFCIPSQYFCITLQCFCVAQKYCEGMQKYNEGMQKLLGKKITTMTLVGAVQEPVMQNALHWNPKILQGNIKILWDNAKWLQEKTKAKKSPPWPWGQNLLVYWLITVWWWHRTGIGIDW